MSFKILEKCLKIEEGEGGEGFIVACSQKFRSRIIFFYVI